MLHSSCPSCERYTRLAASLHTNRVRPRRWCSLCAHLLALCGLCPSRDDELHCVVVCPSRDDELHCVVVPISSRVRRRDDEPHCVVTCAYHMPTCALAGIHSVGDHHPQPLLRFRPRQRGEHEVTATYVLLLTWPWQCPPSPHTHKFHDDPLTDQTRRSMIAPPHTTYMTHPRAQIPRGGDALLGFIQLALLALPRVSRLLHLRV